jgi:hypothetical protein
MSAVVVTEVVQTYALYTSLARIVVEKAEVGTSAVANGSIDVRPPIANPSVEGYTIIFW